MNIMSVVRTSWKWIALCMAVAFVVWRVKYAPVPVTACKVAVGPIVAEVMGYGTLQARVKTTITPRIAEQLAEVLVDQGDIVTNGQLLARLDDAEPRRLVEIAQATLEAARATAERVRSDEARALAVEKMMRQDYERVTNLMTTKVSSQAELDKASEQLGIAAAELLHAQAAFAEAQRQVVVTEKTLAHQQERLAFTRVLSPYDGLIVRRDRDPGGLVIPGGSLLQLISTNELWISAWIDETAITMLVTGQPARIVFRSEPETNYPGRLARLGRETDRETREFVADVHLSSLPRNWTAGQRAEVYVETGRKKEAVVVPQRFVQWRIGAPGVFVEKGGHARWQAIKLGLRGRESVEVASGLAVGDVVVMPRDAKQELKDGQRIAAQ